MPQHASVARVEDVPPAPTSETKLVAELAPEPKLVAELAPEPAPEPAPESGPVAASLDPSLDADWPTLSVLSRRYIDRALAYTKNNKTRAADLLGIDRRTLNRILARERAKKPSA